MLMNVHMVMYANMVVHVRITMVVIIACVQAVGKVNIAKLIKMIVR
jgi:hypothetical protein